MRDISFLLFGVLLLGLAGVPAALLLPRTIPARLTLAPVLGYALIAILAPNLFAAGLGPRAQLWLYGALAAAGLLALLYRARQGARPPRESLRLGGAWALAAAALSLPAWMMGEQYYAYLGNIWDYFNYATVGALVAKLPPAALSPAAAADAGAALLNPLLPWASGLGGRPAVILVFAVLAGPFLAQGVPLLALANAYMSLLLSLALFSLHALLRSATAAGPVARLVIPLTFICGFWGGYLLDVDAWSQLAAVMLLPALFALGLPQDERHPADGIAARGAALRLGLGLALLAAAVIYLYPELLPVYLPIYGVALLVALAASGWRPGRLVPQLVAAPLALLLAALSYSATLGFIGRQMHTISADDKLSAGWFDYFHAFLLGGDNLAPFTRDGGSHLQNLLRYGEAVAAVAGLYRVTPDEGTALAGQIAATAAEVALVVALLYAAWRSLRPSLRWLPAMLATGALVMIGLALERNLYGAGKIFFWLSPFLLLLLLLPLSDARAPTLTRLPAYGYLLLQAASMAVRLASIAAEHGIPGLPPYPGDFTPGRKAAMELNLAALFPDLDACRLVRVDLEDPFLRHYAMLNLFARGIRYYPAAPVNSYYGVGRELGESPVPGRADCTLVRGEAPPAGGRADAFRLMR